MTALSRASSEEILRILKQKSKRSVGFAKKKLLTEKIESSNIREAMKYYISTWEFSTHQGLFGIAYESVGGNLSEAVEVQAAMAMLTAAVDVHDDVIDASQTKHGRQTIFGKYGQDVAVLLGDAFFVSGFTLLGKSITNLPPEKARQVIETVKRLMFEVGTAHALELNLRKRTNVHPEECMRILRMKAAGTESSMKLGAILGGGTTLEIKILAKYGRILGLLATLREEFIDVYEAEELRQRIEKECLPAPILYALQGETSRDMQAILDKPLTDGDPSRILDLVLKSTETKKLIDSMKIMIDKGLRLLPQVINDDSRELLSILLKASLEDLE